VAIDRFYSCKPLRLLSNNTLSAHTGHMSFTILYYSRAAHIEASRRALALLLAANEIFPLSHALLVQWPSQGWVTRRGTRRRDTSREMHAAGRSFPSDCIAFLRQFIFQRIYYLHTTCVYNIIRVCSLVATLICAEKGVAREKDDFIMLEVN
jgi:hypothetical protein